MSLVSGHFSSFLQLLQVNLDINDCISSIKFHKYLGTKAIIVASSFILLLVIHKLYTPIQAEYIMELLLLTDNQLCNICCSSYDHPITKSENEINTHGFCCYIAIYIHGFRHC